MWQGPQALSHCGRAWVKLSNIRLAWLFGGELRRMGGAEWFGPSLALPSQLHARAQMVWDSPGESYTIRRCTIWPWGGRGPSTHLLVGRRWPFLKTLRDRSPELRVSCRWSRRCAPSPALSFHAASTFDNSEAWEARSCRTVANTGFTLGIFFGVIFWDTLVLSARDPDLNP